MKPIDDYLNSQRQIVIPEDVLKRLIVYREQHRTFLGQAERLMTEFFDYLSDMERQGDDLKPESIKYLLKRRKTLTGWVTDGLKDLKKHIGEVEQSEFGLWWNFKSHMEFQAYLRTVTWDDLVKRIAQLEEFQLGAGERMELGRLRAAKRK